MTVFHEFRAVLSPVLLSMIQANHGPVSASDLNAILVKDAIYNAVGLAAFDLYDEVCILVTLASETLHLPQQESNLRWERFLDTS